MLEILSPRPRRVYAGQRFIIRFRTDADPAYFLNPDTFIAVINPPTFGQYTGTTNVRDGYGTAYFRATADLEVGATANLALEVRPRRSTSLHDTIQAEVIPLPTEAGTGAGRVNTPNINPQWVTEGDEFWNEHNWNDHAVAKVVRTDDSIDVFVSAEHRRLNSLISRAQRREASTVDSIKDFYLEHMSFYSVLAELEQQQVQARLEGAGGQIEPQEMEQEQERELQRACEMLCGVMEDLFEVLANRATGGNEDELPDPDGEAEEEEVGFGS